MAECHPTTMKVYDKRRFSPSARKNQLSIGYVLSSLEEEKISVLSIDLEYLSFQALQRNEPKLSVGSPLSFSSNHVPQKLPALMDRPQLVLVEPRWP